MERLVREFMALDNKGEPYIDYEEVEGVIIESNMTNGDIIKQMFPDVEVRYPREDIVYFTLDGIVGVTVTCDWWNLLYKEK